VHLSARFLFKARFTITTLNITGDMALTKEDIEW